MEQNLELKRNSGDGQFLGTSWKTLVPSQSIKLQERSKQGKNSFSADLLRTEKFEESPAKAFKNHQKEHIAGKITEEEEIIKYMSNLPSYLEHGDNIQEKLLNVGVLDWGRLEKWHYSQKQIPHRSPPTSSNRPSSFSTDGSSSHSSKSHSSPARQRMHRPSLHSHLIASPIGAHSQVVKSSGECDVKYKSIRPLQTNEQGKVIRTDQMSCKNHRSVKLEQLRRKDPEPKTYSERKTQNSEVTRIAYKFQKPDSNYIDHCVLKAPEGNVTLLSRDLPISNHTGVPQLSDSIALLSQRSEETSQKIFIEKSNDLHREVKCHTAVPHPCQAAYEFNIRNLQVSSTLGEDVKFSVDRSQSVIQSAKTGLSPTRMRMSEERKTVKAPSDSTAEKSSSGLDQKAGKNTADKVRSFSPFSRLNIGMGKRSKSSSSIEDLDAPPINEKRRSSPLRRLLDPILKPKEANCNPAVEPLDKSRKVKLDMSRCKKVDVKDAAQDKKRGPNAVQALLQVAVKNGLPLFTFAVDNVSDVLAATMKLTSTGKEKSSRTYTFFTIQEVKKKNGSWINQGSKDKGKGHDYISNVIAQMKVSEPQFSNFTRHDEISVREFVLFSVDVRQADHQTSEFKPHDELAAIIIKIPRNIKQSSITTGLQRNICNDLPNISSKECFPAVKSYSTSGESLDSRPSAESLDSISTTVILPGGIHSLPSTGGPSSLIQRWNSGGACDCGGWDLGCELRILANRNRVIKNSTSSKSCNLKDQLELFSQGGVQENQPVLRLTAFKDKIYSIEFNSSLSLMQAFSICIAMLDGRNPYEPSESSKSFEEKA